MRKKISIFLLLLTLVLTTVLAGCGGGTEPAPDDEAATPEAEEPADETGEEEATEEPAAEGDEDESFVSEYVGQDNTLIFGDSTGATGDWETFWANNAMDYVVLNMTQKNATMEWDFEGASHVNPTVVENVEATENEDGSKTYTWTIKDGLVWNDGTPITAHDYVAGVMFGSSPQMVKFKSKGTGGYYLKGYEAWHNAEKKEFEGVRLLDEKTFALTIAAENLPNFYEQVNASSAPFKLSYWIGDDTVIKDDGEGCYFDGPFGDMISYGVEEEPEEEAPAEEEGEEGEEAEETEEPVELTEEEQAAAEEAAAKEGLSEEQAALYDRFNASIQAARFGTDDWPSSGPYKIKSYNKGTKEVVLEINDKYPGNYEGHKPSVQTVVIQEVFDSTAMDQFKTGQISLLLSQTSGDTINAGLDLVEDGDQFDYVTYPRAGYGLLDFKCDVGPTRFKEVRHAIAKLLDRNEFVQKFTAGFGSVVQGPYGEGQWFYQETKDELLSKVNAYEYSPEDAVALLVEAGYTLNANGEEYKEGDGTRHRQGEDGELEPLLLKWCSTSNNPVSDILKVLLVENPEVQKAGIEIKQETMDFGELLEYYYRSQDDPKYAENDFNMFNLATGFNKTYDMTDSFSSDPAKIALGYNGNYLIDEELEEAANAMVKTDPEDRDGFKEKFVNYITIWNDRLPQIPLYSNEYHDFYDKKIKNYNNSSMADMSMVILYASMED